MVLPSPTGKKSGIVEEKTMQAQAQALWEQYNRIHSEIFKWSEGLTNEQLNRKPPAKDGNSIANLMSHILGAELSLIVERIGGQSVARDRSAEFTNPVTRDTLLQRRAEVEARVRETLDKLTPADFERPVSAPGGGETAVGNLLIYLVSHLSGHMGQVILTRKFLDAAQ
jgi:uncharacterized damage-inducible protein DinB